MQRLTGLSPRIGSKTNLRGHAAARMVWYGPLQPRPLALRLQTLLAPAGTVPLVPTMLES